MIQEIDNKKIRDMRIPYPEMEVKMVFLTERFLLPEGEENQPSKPLTIANIAMNPLPTWCSLLNSLLLIEMEQNQNSCCLCKDLFLDIP